MHFRLDADLEDVVFVRGEGEFAACRVVLVVEKVVLRVEHLDLGLVASDLGDLVLALDEHVFVNLLLEAFARVCR